MFKNLKFKERIEKFCKKLIKHRKPLASLAIALVVCGTGTVMYATQYTTIKSPSKMPYKLAGHPTGMKKGTSGSYYAYCVTPEKVQPTGQEYSDGDKIPSVAYTVLGYGYPNYRYTGNDEADYFITQAALWKLLGKVSDTSAGNIVVQNSAVGARATNPGKNSTFSKGEEITAQSLAKAIDNLYTSATRYQHEEGGSLHFYDANGSRYDDINNCAQLADKLRSSDSTIPEGYRATQWLSLDCPDKNWIYPYALSIKFSQNNVGAKFQGFGDNALIDSVPVSNNGTKFRILVPESMSETETVGFQAEGTTTIWKSCYSTPNSGNSQDLYIVWETQGSCLVKGTVTNQTTQPKDGNIKIRKVNKSEQPLAGAEFTLSGNGKNLKAVSGSDGWAVWNAQQIGTYTIKETAAPAGYELSSETWTANVTANTTKVLEFKCVDEAKDTPEQKKFSVKLHKIDEKGNSLAGAEFTLHNKTGSYSIPKTTDSTGKLEWTDVPIAVPQTSQDNSSGSITVGDEEGEFSGSSSGTADVPEGENEFILEETKAPDGYELSMDKKEINPVDGGQEEFSYEIENTPSRQYGWVELYKIDPQHVKLEGVGFALINKATGEEVQSGKTDWRGYLKFENIPYEPEGTDYIVKETEPLPGFAFLEEDWEFTLKSGHESYSKTIQNNHKYYQGSVTIIKKDSDNQVPLPGATINLYDSNGKVVGTKTTGGDGKVIFDNLDLGEYWYQEIQAPHGYTLDSTKYKLEITERNLDAESILPNKKYGSIILTKVDDVGHPLEGAYFQLFDKDMNPVGEPKKSQGNGQVIWDPVELGQYYVKETQAPEGYQIGKFVKGIEITERNRDGRLDISNQIIYGSLTIVKTNENDHALRGAEFAIYNDEGILLETKKTTTNGTVIFEHLPVGYYTIVETNPPEGYIPISKNVNVKGEEVMNCEITMRHLDQQIYVQNKPIVGNVHIIKTDATDKHKLADAIFALYDDKGHEIASARTDDWGNAWFKNIKYGKYTMREVACPNGYEQNDTIYDVNICEDECVLEYNIENKPITYRLILHKDDTESGEPLAGAEFQLWQNGGPLGINGKTTFVTDSRGELEFPFDLEYGEYQLVETKPPYGYIASETVNLWLDETTAFQKDSLQNRLVDITVHNQSKRTKLKLTKIDDDTGLPLQNAKFEVWNEDRSQCIASGETGPTGIVMFDLKLGTYWYKEVEAPEGYAIDPTWRQVIFTDTSDGLTQSFRVSNKRSEERPPSGDSVVTKEEFPSIEILKIDADTGEPLPNAGFVIYDEDGETVLKRGLTGEDGKVKFQLNKGTFWYQEFMAPDGYLCDNQKYKFTLEENNKTLQCEMTNKKNTPNIPQTPETPTPTPDTPTPETSTTPEGEVDICKTDVSTGELLPNATFFIYGTDQKTAIVSGETNEEGIARFKLPVGDYYYQEFSAPEGYEVDTSKYPFSIKENGEIVKCRMTDVPKGKPTLPNTGSTLANDKVVMCFVIIIGSLASILLLVRRFTNSRKRKRQDL